MCVNCVGGVAWNYYACAIITLLFNVCVLRCCFFAGLCFSPSQFGRCVIMPTTKHWTTEPDGELMVKVERLRLPSSVCQPSLSLSYFADHSLWPSLRPSFHSQRGFQEGLQEIRLQTCSQVKIHWLCSQPQKTKTHYPGNNTLLPVPHSTTFSSMLMCMHSDSRGE